MDTLFDNESIASLLPYLRHEITKNHKGCDQNAIYSKLRDTTPFGTLAFIVGNNKKPTIIYQDEKKDFDWYDTCWYLDEGEKLYTCFICEGVVRAYQRIVKTGADCYSSIVRFG